MIKRLLKALGLITPSVRERLTDMTLFSKEGRSEVFRAQFEDKVVAVKVFHDHEKDMEKSDYEERNIVLFTQEILNLQNLKHPNIIQLYDFILEDSYKCLVLEFMSNKSFMHYLRTHKHDTRDKELCKRIALDVSKGLVYLHGLGYIYFDMKPDNVLLDDQMNAKLCDFEMAEMIIPEISGGQKIIAGRRGTPRWSAPEKYAGRPKITYTQAYDVYPLGWLIHCGQAKEDFTPYGEKYTSEQVQDFHKTGKLPEIDDTVAPGMKSLILHCLKFKPEERPTALEVQERLKLEM